MFVFVLGITLNKESSEQPQYLSSFQDSPQLIQDQVQDDEPDEEDEENPVTPTPTSDNLTIDAISDDICEKLCKISQFGNFGDFLNLKVYSIVNNF